METNSLDYSAVTAAQKEVWASGDFSVVALSIMGAAEALVATADPHSGTRVLDVACGSGNVALVAARRYCEVTGVDYVPALLDRGRLRAAAEGTPIRFVEGDAQALPFENASFDFVLSTFGVMFAPDQARAARELLRVCRPGGTIALASWTPNGAVGEFFRSVGEHAPPPPPGLNPPLRWGTEAGVRELLGAHARACRFERRFVSEYFRSVEHAVEVFCRYFGPTERVLASLDEPGQRALTSDMAKLFRKENRSGDGTLVMPLEYLEASITVA